MKKICLVLAIILCLGTFSGSFQTAPVFAEVQADNTAVDFFETLGVFNRSMDDSILDKTVTRADYSLFVARFLGVDEYNEEVNSYFVDVPKEHYAYRAINALCKLGIFKQGTGIFEPDRAMTYGEALAINLRMSGHSNLAEADGGFPNGYVKIGRKIGHIVNEDTDSAITLRASLDMLKETVTGPVYEPVLFNKVVTYSESNVSLLWIYYRIAKKEGVLNGVNGYSLSAALKAENGYCYVDGKELIIDKFDPQEYFGFSVESYYKVDPETEDETLVFAAKKYGENEEWNVKCKDISSASILGGLSYIDESGRVKKVSFDGRAAVVKNGCRVSEDVNAVLNSKDGSALFIDNNSDGKIDVAVYRVPRLVKVMHNDTIKELIYNEYSYGNVNYDKEEYLNIKVSRASDGGKVTFEQIAYGDVLLVYDSENVLEIIVCDQSIGGIIKSVSVNSKETTLLINDEQIGVNEQYMAVRKLNGQLFAAGKSGIFVVDDEGNIVDVSISLGDNVSLGYVVDQAPVSDAFSNTLKLKIFEQSGKVTVYETAEKWYVDDVKIIDNNISGTDLYESAAFKPQLVCFELDSENKLKRIRTAVPEALADENDTLILTNPEQKQTFSAGPRMFGSKMMLSNDTFCMLVPPDAEIASSQDNEYGLINISYFSDWSGYNVESYKVSINSPMEDIVVCRNRVGNKINSKSDTILVDSFGQNINDDGDPVECMNGLSMGSIVQLNGAVNFSFANYGLERGDVVRVSTNAKGEVVDLQVIYYYGNTGFESIIPAADMQGEHQYWMCYAHSNNQGIVKWGLAKGEDYDAISDMRTVSVMVYNPNLRENQVFPGTYNDILAYSSTKTKGDRMIVRTNRGGVQAVIVYKELESE